MFCSNCGNVVDDGARFCSKCGRALNQSNGTPTYQQPASRQTPVASNVEPVKCSGTLVYPDNSSDMGEFYISPQEIVFRKKSIAVRVAFGFLGSALEKGKEVRRARVADVAHGQRTRIGLNKNVYQITMRNGNVYHLCLDKPKVIAYLESIIG